MTHPDTVNHITYLIIPFVYDKEYKHVVSWLDRQDFEQIDSKSERLFDHIEKLVSLGDQNPETIGAKFVMTQKARSKYGLPNKNDLMLTCQTKTEQYQFSLTKIELYLFETQVGFWSIKLGYPKGINIERLIETNYYAKKITQYEYELFFTKKISKDETIRQNVHIGEMIKELSARFRVSSFFEGTKEIPTQALVYSSAKLDSNFKEDTQLSSYLFQLRRSFKSTYKPSMIEQDLVGNPGLLPLFHNSYWGISLEGLANIVTKTDDEKTEEFFNSMYLHQIENSYFYLYILALHQRYALLRLSNLASKLSYELDVNLDNYTEQNQLIIQLRGQIIRFMLRSSYKQVSNNTHYSQLYEVIRENLKINDLFRELHDELDAISSITEVAEQRQHHLEETAKREQAEKFNNKITNITTLFLPITVITGFFGMNLAFIAEHEEKWWLFIGSTVIIYFFTLWMKKTD